VFGEIRPASAMLVITGTLNQAWKVEIEADALLPE
jgi:enamine deaminase RidA (YjgF/YER057c/UK114 family)